GLNILICRIVIFTGREKQYRQQEKGMCDF
ncbi:MAG: hypothetical protein ACI8P3_003223, partial [Saprospiraceae bacterium]